MSQIVIDFVVKHVDPIYLETYKLDQNWADHAVAFVCWDTIMNQWASVFHLLDISSLLKNSYDFVYSPKYNSLYRLIILTSIVLICIVLAMQH